MALPYLDGQVARVCDICFLRGRKTLPELTRMVSNYRQKGPKDGAAHKMTTSGGGMHDYEQVMRTNSDRDAPISC